MIITIVLWHPWTKKLAIPIPADKPSLAIMYFKNNTGDTALNHWRTMLSNLLITDLTQSKYIKVLSEDRLYYILNQLNQLESETYTSEVLEQVAAQGGVNHILQGAYAKAGDEIRISVMLQEADTGELLGSESVAGRGEESIFSMIDELTKKIKANLKLSEEEIAKDIDNDSGKITTSSPEAYKLYTEAFKYNWEQDFHDSIKLLERAIEIDPEFATAYSLMATVYSSMGDDSKAKESHKKALKLSDRMSDEGALSSTGILLL